MVSFICGTCGNTVKKNQVEKHYQSVCRSCSVLSCIDCGVDFPGDAYMSHTSCISEAEKYQGHLYQPKDKENKGDAKQKEWIKQVQENSGAVKDPRLKSLLERLSEYSNIPRKKKKFENFCKNSVNVYDAKTLDALWEVFNENANKKPVQNGTKEATMGNKITETNDETEENEENKTEKKKKKKKRKLEDDDEEVENNSKKNKKDDDEAEEDKGRFHWHKAIKTALKEADDKELSMKKLRKKVVAAYEYHGFDHRASNTEESRVLFEKKLKTYPKVKIVKNTVKLCKT